ncbi:TPA: hypothetical protein MAL29_004755 [Klebsiella variicola]|nr:hypothetical protein [Klebsiella variicola]
MSVYRCYPVFSSVAKCRDIDEKMQLCCAAKRPFIFLRENEGAATAAGDQSHRRALSADNAGWRPGENARIYTAVTPLANPIAANATAGYKLNKRRWEA